MTITDLSQQPLWDALDALRRAITDLNSADSFDALAGAAQRIGTKANEVNWQARKMADAHGGTSIPLLLTVPAGWRFAETSVES